MKKLLLCLLFFAVCSLWAGEVISLGERIDSLKNKIKQEPSLKANIQPIIDRADELIRQPIFKRVYSLKDFSKLDDNWARKQTAHARTTMMKDKSNAEYFGLASNDVSTMRSMINELPLLAAVYRLTGDKKYLDYLDAQLQEMTTWNPFQRKGWTLRVGSKPLQKDGDGVWLATGTGIQIVVMTLDIMPKGSLSPKLDEALRATLKREMEYIIKDYKDKRPWYVKKDMVQSNQWIVPFSGLTLAALYLGVDKYRDAYALGKNCLSRSLACLGDEGAVSEGFAYAIDWSVPGLLIPAYYMALLAKDREFIDKPFFKNFPLWVVESYQPGKNVINAFDWWGGCRDMYDRYMLTKITMLTVLTASPYLQWILFNEHMTPEPDAFGLFAYGMPSNNMKQPPLFASFKRASRVNWRSSWKADADGVWIRGRDKNDFHAHHDTGHINYIKNGKIVLLEASTTGYSDKRMFYDFKSFRGHNVLQVGEVLKGNDGVDADFNIRQLNNNGGDVELDASAVYDNASWTRSVKWDKKSLEVFDNVKVTAGSPDTILFRWHLGTENPAEIIRKSGKQYEIKIAAGKIEFPVWYGEQRSYWKFPKSDIVQTPAITVIIEADSPIEVKAAKYVDHTFKFRKRYHEHTTLEVSAQAEKLECKTVFIAE